MPPSLALLSDCLFLFERGLHGVWRPFGSNSDFVLHAAMKPIFQFVIYLKLAFFPSRKKTSLLPRMFDTNIGVNNNVLSSQFMTPLWPPGNHESLHLSLHSALMRRIKYLTQCNTNGLRFPKTYNAFYRNYITDVLIC